jgi:Uma2 family endonuclease
MGIGISAESRLCTTQIVASSTVMLVTAGLVRRQTSMAVMPRMSDDWTVDDLEHLPDDGLRYELLDGILLVTPAPVPIHQGVLGELYKRLDAACPRHLKVFVAPSTRRKDQVLKFSIYADSNVASYWIVDPHEPSVVAYDLVAGSYLEVARAQGGEEFTVANPFPLRFRPGDLVDL